MSIPAATYIRMSSGKQELSPDQQRAEAKKLAAKHGCRIVREYFDSGISGNETMKRPEFLKLIRDAEKRKDFQVILCWDQDRFGRFDSIDAGEWIAPLRRAGVRLITAAQGEINWNDFAGRIVYTVAQEGKHQFLRDLARNVCRGHLAGAKRGNNMGSIPFGYERVYFDSSGNQVHRVTRNTKFVRPSGWTGKLVPSTNRIEIETVKWMFKTVLERDVGPTALARLMNMRGGFPTPKGGPMWHGKVCRYILENPAYIGDLVFDGIRPSRGKFVQGTGESTRHQNAHEALIDRQTFKRVQNRIKLRHEQRDRSQWRSALLSGLVKCGMCGGRMIARTQTDRFGVKHSYYNCPNLDGRCRCYGVQQATIDKEVIEWVAEVMVAPEVLERRRKRFKELSTRQSRSTWVNDQRAAIAEVNRRIANGTDNLLLIEDKQTVARAAAKLREWELQRDQLQSELDHANEVTPEAANLQYAIEISERMAQVLQNGEPSQLRACLKHLITRIVVHFHPKEPGQRSRFKRVQIEAAVAVT
ncbi:MAG: recombinase family protein [Blastocatellales bacterium]